MKHHTFGPVAAALILATAGAARAQSSVTVAGIMDLAARQVSNGARGSMRSLVSGSNSTSRLVVRGTEDLGGGLSASFHLEHGIAADTGSPTGGFWDRRSTVSLSDKSWGEVRLGRDFVPSYSNWSRFDPFSYVGVAGSNNLVSATPAGPIRNAFGTAANTTVRSSNAIQFVLPGGLGGLEGGLLVAAGEGNSAALGQTKVTGARLGWSTKDWVVSAAHTQSENDLTRSGSFTDTVVGGSAQLGLVKLGTAWRQFKQGTAKQTNLMLAAQMRLGNGELKASVVKADFAGSAGTTTLHANGAQQLGLGYVHNLSKRTALYATLARVSNDGAVSFQVPGGPSGLVAGGRSSGYEAGVRHNF